MSALLLQAEGAKRRAATLMNERSSRAHSLLFLNLQQTTLPTRRTASGASAGSGSGEVEPASVKCKGPLRTSESDKAVRSGVLSILRKTTSYTVSPASSSTSAAGCSPR